MTRRRDFMKTLGAAALGHALRPRAPSPDPRAVPRKLSRIGLGLFSVRDAMARDPERTLAAVRASGYTDVELLWSFGNFGRTTEQVRAALDKEGLRAPSAHCSPTILFVGWDRSLAIAHRLGHEFLIVPSFTPDTARSLDDWREWADRFNAAGAAARRAGIWLAFHNEAEHMTPIDGTVPYDLFVPRTDPTVARHPPAARRPGRRVDRPLRDAHIRHHADHAPLAPIGGHQAQVDVLVEWVVVGRDVLHE